MGYGDALGLTVPTVGVTSGLTAAGLVNTALQAMIDVLESKVTPSGMDINADVSFQSGTSYFGAIDLHRIGLTSLAAVLSAVTYPGTLYRVGSDLYFNDAAGNQVRLVSGGVVDASTAGAITGAGYGASGVEVNWDAGNTKYKFKSGSGSDSYAALECDDVLLRDGSGNAVRLASPALAGDYNFILPNAAPGSTSVVQMDSAGALTASNTIVNDLTLASGKHVTVVGSGQYKHGTFELIIPAAAGVSSDGVNGWVWLSALAANPLRWELGTGGSAYAVDFPINLDIGKRIVAITVRLRDTVSENAITVKAYKVLVTSGVATQLGSTQTSAADGSYQALTISGLTETVDSEYTYHVCVSSDASAPAHHWVFGCMIDYDRP